MSTNKDERHISSSPTWDNPKIEGHKLEGNIYTSKEVLQKELDYLWPNVWLLMGRADGIPDTGCLLYTSPSPRDGLLSRMPSSA